MLAPLDQAVKGFAINQRLKTGTDVHIGRRLSGRGITKHADRVIRPGQRKITNLRFKGERLRSTFTAGLTIHRHKRGVIHDNPYFFDRSNEEILFTVFTQNT